MSEFGTPRHAITQRGEGIISKLKRLLSLWSEGRTDEEISEALGGAGSGWSRRNVKRYRQVLRLIDPEKPAWRVKRKPAASGRWSAF